MGTHEMLEKVRKALRIADGIHDENAEVAAALVDAVGRCRDAQNDLQRLLCEYKPQTLEGVQACEELLGQLRGVDCGEDLLVRVLASYDPPESMIYVRNVNGQPH